MRPLAGAPRVGFVLIMSTLWLALAGCAADTPRSVPSEIEPQLVDAALVQANNCLFRKSACNAPALVVFSLDSNIALDDLHRLAELAYSTKGGTPADPNLRVLSRMVTNEAHHEDAFVKVPEGLGYGRNTYLADVWLQHERLAEGYLRSRRALRFRVYVVGGKPYTARFVSDVDAR